ncbi:major facilitator superfamily domain-containing protein [Penicillium verhagenii]|nr:major facilitator superfamily domain-containing protein [Penicillium verhagenii]
MDETTPLTKSQTDTENEHDKDHVPNPADTPMAGRKSKVDMMFFVPALLGVFLALADDSFVLSTHTEIASHFNHISLGSWLVTAYNLGYGMTLPLYGRLCDIYGYKLTLLAAYLTFSIGCVMRELTVLRSYISMVGTVAYSLGAPLGGALTDAIDWRWSFLIQSPLGLLCFFLALWRLPSVTSKPKFEENDEEPSRPELNLTGICLLGIVIAAIMGLCQFIEDKSAKGTFMLAALSTTVVIGMILYALNERYWTRNPLAPMSLLKIEGIYTIYISQVLMFFCASGICSNLAEYWVRTQNASNGLAAASIVPMTLGMVVSSAVYGRIMKRTGKYKALAISGCGIGIISCLMIGWRWPQSPTPTIWEQLYPFGLGFGLGGSLAASFVGLSASIPDNVTAPAFTIYYLCQQVGMILGVTVASMISRGFFKTYLLRNLGQSADSLEVRS